MPANEYLQTWQNQQREALNFPTHPRRNRPSQGDLTRHGVPPGFASFLTEIAYPSGADVEILPNGGVFTRDSDDDLDSMLGEALRRVLSCDAPLIRNDAFRYAPDWKQLKKDIQDVAIGGLFLGQMNAGIVSPLPRDAVIVFDPDFLSMLHRMSRLLVGGIGGRKDEHDFFIYEGWQRTRAFGHKLSIEEAHAVALEFSEWFRTGGSRQSFDTPRTPLHFGWDGPRQYDLGWLIDGQACSLFRAMLDFIVAHEVSHLVLGHLDTSSVNRMMFPAVDLCDVKALQESWEDEFDADRCATELFILTRQSEPFCEGAPDVVFLIYELFEKFGVIMDPRCDHPPPRNRLDRIRVSPFDRIRPEAQSFVASVKDTFDQLVSIHTRIR